MTRRIEKCRSCGAAVLWSMTPGGNWMILDAEPDPEGSMVLEHGRARAYQALVHSHLDRYRPHWARCPDADSWRRSR